jgi:hypothetical protein
MTFADQISREIERLPLEQQQEVLRYLRSLAPALGALGEDGREELRLPLDFSDGYFDAGCGRSAVDRQMEDQAL